MESAIRDLNTCCLASSLGRLVAFTGGQFQFVQKLLLLLFVLHSLATNQARLVTVLHAIEL